MADAIVSAVAERIIGLIEEQARYHINLVRGAEKEVRSLAKELNTVRNVLDDAENRRFKEKSVRDWLVRLEHTSYEMEDVLDEWNYDILKLQIEKDHTFAAAVAPSKKKVWTSFIPSSSCFCFKKVVVRHRIAEKILDVKAQLDEVLREKDRYDFVMSQPTADPSHKSWRDPSTSFTDLAEIRGRDFDRDILLTKLIANGGRQKECLGVQVVSIVGVGGLGKTTLAQLVYNDTRVEKSFDLRIWVCVSDHFDLAAIAKVIIESVEKRDPPSTNNLEILLQRLRDSILGKKFLLVLDDVWAEDPKKWEPLKSSLKCGGVGSKVLVTTRNQNVAEIMDTIDDDIHHLGKLTDEDCWLLLCNEAFSGRNKERFEAFKDTGKKIAEKCKGLPLAAKVLGSLLRSKSSLEDWENVLNSEIWQLEKAEVELFPHLLLSYNEFSPRHKRCFSYCAVFPKDSRIDVEDLIGKWMALGYLGSNIDDMELRGRECFEVLAMHSLFQDFEKNHLDGQVKSCKMHDIVHDFARFLRKSTGRVQARGLNHTACEACDPLSISIVNEFRSLSFRYGEVPLNLCACLRRLRTLNLSWCVLQSIPQGMANLIHLRWLNLDGSDLSIDDLKIIFLLYNLQTLCLSLSGLREIPSEIGNLIHLRRLDLSRNDFKELPESICGLHELRTLNIDGCRRLIKLPEGMHRLLNLKHIHNDSTEDLKWFPQGIAQLSGLRRLDTFIGGGNGWSKLGLLKNLNHLGEFLKLKITLAGDDDLEEVVRDAREAELKKKKHIQQLVIKFVEFMEKDERKAILLLDLLDALEPHPNLQKLNINSYGGSKLPDWIASPGLNHLRTIVFDECYNIPSLPSFGKLPCLEEIVFMAMYKLQFVGREFLGITGDMDIQSSSNTVVAFPKLKKLWFDRCSKWMEWEDITAEEEESAAVSVMPCLTEMTLQGCQKLTALPHRLLRKASSLEVLDLSSSLKLQKRYGDKKSSVGKSIFQNPRLQIRWVNQRSLSLDIPKSTPSLQVANQRSHSF